MPIAMPKLKLHPIRFLEQSVMSSIGANPIKLFCTYLFTLQLERLSLPSFLSLV
jgi:hypothetical protein